MFSVTNKFHTSFVKFGGPIGSQFSKRYVSNVGNWKKERKGVFSLENRHEIIYLRQKTSQFNSL